MFKMFSNTVLVLFLLIMSVPLVLFHKNIIFQLCISYVIKSLRREIRQFLLMVGKDKLNKLHFHSNSTFLAIIFDN